MRAYNIYAYVYCCQQRCAFYDEWKLHVSECVYMCRESGSKDEEDGFMGKAAELLERMIEKGRFLWYRREEGECVRVCVCV